MSGQLLFEYLERHRATYSIKNHIEAFTAPEVAQNSHIQGHSMAKVVMIKADGELAMVVLPAHFHVDPDLLSLSLDVETVELAREREFSYRFPRCEVGAMPPFGHLYGLITYMVPVFDENRQIAFTAGNHHQVILMNLEEYIRLAHVTLILDGVIPPALTPPKIHRRRPRFRY